MSYRPVLTSRSLVPIAALLAVVIVAISPRSLLAPALSFSQAQESKRPKTPKNIVRTDPASASVDQRAGKSPRPSPAAKSSHETAGLPVRPVLASGIPERALRLMTQPDYLRLIRGSPPGNLLAPPA